MGRKPDLPCDIEQVVDLLGIEVIRDTGTQLHCRCPFCADRKAHMNVKIRDNVFRCNRCGKGGGIIAGNTCKADFLYENLLIQNNVIHSIKYCLTKLK